jgi:hypothetical protein
VTVMQDRDHTETRSSRSLMSRQNSRSAATCSGSAAELASLQDECHEELLALAH